MVDAGPYMGLGVQLATAVLAFVLGGYLVDYLFDTEPWGIIIGSVLGIVAFMAQLFRLVATLGKEKGVKGRSRSGKETSGRTDEPAGQ